MLYIYILIFLHVDYNIDVKFTYILSRFQLFIFPSPTMFMEPIQLGHQKFILTFTLCVNFAFHIAQLAIFPYD
jgi:hypothetical protein